MQYIFKQSYIRSIKKLDKNRAKSVHKSFESLLAFFQTGEKTPGLGLKQLRYNIWEIRAGLMDRIIFHQCNDCIEFIIVGTHDEIRKYLKNI